MDNKNMSITRRSLLRSIGAGSVMGGMIGVSSAHQTETISYEDQRSVERKYETESLSKELVEEHAQSVLNGLVEYGFLETPTVRQLPLDNHIKERAGLKPDEDQEGFAVTTIGRDGEPTPHIAIKLAAEKFDIGLYIQPEQNSSYAIAVDESGEETLFDPSVGEPVTNATTNVYCGGECNMYHQHWTVTEKCYRGHGCGVVDKTCVCTIS